MMTSTDRSSSISRPPGSRQLPMRSVHSSESLRIGCRTWPAPCCFGVVLADLGSLLQLDFGDARSLGLYEATEPVLALCLLPMIQLRPELLERVHRHSDELPSY